MVTIALQGICGRMGRAVLAAVENRTDCTIVAGVDTGICSALPCPVFNNINGLAGLDTPPDVLVDFSHPDATGAALDYCSANQLPIVVCTTGLSDEALQKVQETALKTAVFHSANMSLGINLLARLVQRAQAVLKGFDIEIIEKHHRNKLDAPSGTALMLADAINQQAGGRYEYVYDRQPVRRPRGDDELGISAVRGGSIVGEHEVLFAGPDEVINLSHVAYSRDVFATGAVAAALFLAGKPAGLYSMDHLLEEI